MNKIREVTYQTSSQLATKDVDRCCSDTSPATKMQYFKRVKQAFARFVQQKLPIAVFFETLIDELAHKRQHAQLSHSSLRQYRASYQYALVQTVVVKRQLMPYLSQMTQEQRDFFGELAEHYSLSQLDFASERLLAIGHETGGQLQHLDRQAKQAARTSSTKSKGFDKQLYAQVMQDTLPSRYFLREFIYFNCLFGLRPVEWLTVQALTLTPAPAGVATTALSFTTPNEQGQETGSVLFDGVQTAFTPSAMARQRTDLLGLMSSDNEGVAQHHDLLDGKPQQQSQYCLVVKNAKHTHGRACGERRVLFFDMQEEVFARLQILITWLQSKDLVDGWVGDDGDALAYENSPALLKLANALRYFLKSPACQTILQRIHQKRLRHHRVAYRQAIRKGKTPPPPPVFVKPTLYSTRHQAIANAKAHGVHPIHIAALFGHISVLTAERHYAPIHQGSGGSIITPDVRNVAIVLENLNPGMVQAWHKELAQKHPTLAQTFAGQDGHGLGGDKSDVMPSPF